ncbi:MAG: hypothetical protein ABJ387_08720 [Balneola sp.]
MNSLSTIAELDELKDHIDTLIADLAEGKYDDNGKLSFQIYLSHLMEHINKTWHFSKLSNEEIFNLDQTTFEEITNSIPKLDPNFKLVKPEKKFI